MLRYVGGRNCGKTYNLIKTLQKENASYRAYFGDPPCYNNTGYISKEQITSHIKELSDRITYLEQELRKISIELDVVIESEIEGLAELEYYYEEELKCKKSQKEILEILLKE